MTKTSATAIFLAGASTASALQAFGSYYEIQSDAGVCYVNKSGGEGQSGTGDFYSLASMTPAKPWKSMNGIQELPFCSGPSSHELQYQCLPGASTAGGKKKIGQIAPTDFDTDAVTTVDATKECLTPCMLGNFPAYTVLAKSGYNQHVRRVIFKKELDTCFKKAKNLPPKKPSLFSRVRANMAKKMIWSSKKLPESDAEVAAPKQSTVPSTTIEVAAEVFRHVESAPPFVETVCKVPNFLTEVDVSGTEYKDDDRFKCGEVVKVQEGTMIREVGKGAYFVHHMWDSVKGYPATAQVEGVVEWKKHDVKYLVLSHKLDKKPTYSLLQIEQKMPYIELFPKFEQALPDSFTILDVTTTDFKDDDRFKTGAVVKVKDGAVVYDFEEKFQWWRAKISEATVGAQGFERKNKMGGYSPIATVEGVVQSNTTGDVYLAVSHDFKGKTYSLLPARVEVTKS